MISKSSQHRHSGKIVPATAFVTGLSMVGIADAHADRGSSQDTRQAITSQDGKARFQVLSPTLIRTEYAADKNFNTQPTLTCKEGSGQFTDANLKLSLKNGQQDVTTSPWDQNGDDASGPVCQAGSVCQAEDLNTTSVDTNTNHENYTGDSFLERFNISSGVGPSVSFRVNLPQAVDNDADAVFLRYANGDSAGKTASLSVDGGTPHQFNLASTGDWDTWGRTSAGMPGLTAGRHTITSRAAANSDTGGFNLDSLAVLPSGSTEYPSKATSSSQGCTYGVPCEAETGQLSGGAGLALDHNGASQGSFVAGLKTGDAADKFTVNDVPADSTYNLQLRYANWLAGGQKQPQSRPVEVTDGGGNTSQASLPATSSWNSWQTATAPIQLKKGTNTLTLGCSGSIDCNINLDTVAFTDTNAATVSPHAPLGGYRRGLDTTNGADSGSPRLLTSPGILYQDGWSLLDDTTSTWDTLKYQVGYTGGESAATGLVPVSHDIGGHAGGGNYLNGQDGDIRQGAEKGSTQLSADLYARWLQLGTFQPIVRPLYLQYPDQQAYGQADSEYLYGPDVFVAPVTSSNNTTTVWFPKGTSWTDYFTGKTYQGSDKPVTITSDLKNMPVFIKSGGAMTTRSNYVTGDMQTPSKPNALDQVTATVAAGASSSGEQLYEDNGTTTDPTDQSATTSITYTDANHTLTIGKPSRIFAGQVTDRTWTVKVVNADKEPASVSINGATIQSGTTGQPNTWHYDSNHRTVTVYAPSQKTSQELNVSLNY